MNDPRDPRIPFSTLLDLDPSDKQAAPAISRCIEHVYGVQNKRLPTSFRESLLTYSLSSSKCLVNLNGATKPAGTYSYLTNWLSEQSKDELEFPEGVVRCLFDNEQVVG